MLDSADAFAAAITGAADDQSALALVVNRFAAETGTLHRIESDGFLHLVALVGAFPPPVMDAIRTIPVGKGLAGLAAERREPITVCNLQTDTSGAVRPGAKATGMEGAITVPSLRDDGSVAGVLGIANRTPRDYSALERTSLTACARQFALRWRM
jgi:signal transduction protein with GAF and PtsI domain